MPRTLLDFGSVALLIAGMRDRSPTVSRAARAARSASVSLDIVLCAPRDDQLAVLLVRTAAGARERWSLPWTAATPDGSLAEIAARAVLAAAGARAPWLAQLGAFADARRHPGGAAYSVGYVGVTPRRDIAPPAGAEWFRLIALPPLAPRHRAMVDAAAAALRERLGSAPVAFHLLPPTFTLTELQEVYELLLGRRLHKASFRRALQAAYLVEPTDEWRSEGRGRPAQLFRFAPRKRRGARRGVRFDQIGAI